MGGASEGNQEINGDDVDDRWITQAIDFREIIVSARE